jgi:transcriptional regulator with XRE-family HTH domain
MNLSRDLGMALRGMRKARGLSVDQMAQALGMHPKTLGRIERGQTDVRARDITAWAQACNAIVAVTNVGGAWALTVTMRKEEPDHAST